MKNMHQEIKNILFVISSLTSGGAERVIVELANYFASKGIKVKIILFSFNDVAYKIQPGVELIFLCDQVNGINRLLNVLKRFSLLRRYFKESNADIIISFISIVNIYSCVAALFLGKKLIISERNDPATVFVHDVMNKIRNITYKLANGYVFQTSEAQEYFKGKIRRNSTTIPNPIKEKLPAPYNGQRRKAIVACARLFPQKNYPLLLKAFADLDERFMEYTLEIYGSGELLQSLKTEAKELGIADRLHFLGVRTDWHELAIDASLFVMTSDYEGIPNSLMEAVACGIPSISTDCPCGGPRMLIQDGENGFLVPVGDEKKLKATIEKVLDDKELSDKVSFNGVNLRDKYSVEKISNTWLEYIQKVIVHR